MHVVYADNIMAQTDKPEQHLTVYITLWYTQIGQNHDVVRVHLNGPEKTVN